MEALAFVLGFVALGALALRFGQDRSEGIRSKEHELAAHEMTWNNLAIDRDAFAPGTASPSAPRPYPTLAFIERALGAPAGALTAAPDAARLEVRARALAADYWSDSVWTTGVVPGTAFRRVLAELAPALLGTPILAVERPVAVAAPARPARSTAVPDREAATRNRTMSLGVAGSSATA